MTELREQVIRLAYAKRHLRPYLLPLVVADEESSEQDTLVVRELGEGGIDETEIRNILAIPGEDALSDHYTPKQAVGKLVEKLGEDEARNVISWTATMTHAPFYQQMENLIK